nr:UDP-4-amino-4,6-dideoxy-N-acetyl-beta-L-altrosamine transaminase [Campylobacter sp.]
MNYIPYSTQSIDDSDINEVVQALKSDYLTGGARVGEFEKALCDYTGAKFAVVMNSATSALHAAYNALGLGQGDEIITTPITFAATSNAALMCGAEIKFAGVLESGNIDPATIENLITNRTKIITPVDLGGLPVDMEQIQKIATKHNLKIVDDASHALGSSINNKKVGNLADVSIFSFHPVKPITSLEGGAVLTNDEEIASKARLFRNHGSIAKNAWHYDISMLGYNYRLSDVGCALGINQLKKLDKFIDIRNEIAEFYENEFAKNPYFSTIKIPQNVRSSRHLYIIKLFSNLWQFKEDIFNELKSCNIGVQVHYIPTYKFSLYEQKYGLINIKSVEDFYNSSLSIPCHQKMSLDDAKFVANTLFEVLEKYSIKQNT